MNRLYKILLLMLVVALAACNPTKDLKKQIEEQATAPKASLNYTLTNADYTSLSSIVLQHATTHADTVAASKIKSSQYLMGSYDHTYIPYLLSSLYPALGDKSSAHVTYNYDRGYLAETTMYEDASQYTLSDADYQSMGGAVSIYKYFSPSNPASDYLPDFLTAKYPSDTNGTLRLVKYKFANTDPAGGEITLLDEGFNGSFDNFDTVNVSGSQVWKLGSYNQTEYANMSGYSGGNQANEDWLISPAIDLNGFTSPSVQIDQAINYWNSSTYPNHIQILVSTDYDGSKDVASATWTPLNISQMPTGSNWTFVTSEKVDLSAYAGKKIYIAFKYVSTSSDAPNWEIDWMKVYGTISGGSGSGVTPTVLTGGAYYKLSGGTWGPVSGAYYLNSADYAGMGGSIGKYGDFSSSDSPDNYLPQFLAQKYPYAQKGDQVDVAYNYYSSGLHVYVDQYTFDGSMWTKYDPVTVETSPFVNNGSSWLFDPTVYFTMSVDDYQLIVDVVKNSHPSLVNSYGDGETYYGADAYYGDFNAVISNRSGQSDFSGLSDAAATTLILQRIQEGLIVMLQQKFPDSPTQVSGVDQKYVVTYNIYTTGNISNTSTFQCTKAGPNPEFKLIDGAPHE